MEELEDEEKVLQDDVYSLYDFLWDIVMGFFDKGESFRKALKVLDAKTNYENWVSPRTNLMLENEQTVLFG